MTNKKPLAIFKNQQANAMNRGIEWLITFDEWWAIWEASGKWPLRGKRRGQYCMARKGDVGPYSAGNVYISEAAQNSRDALINKPRDMRLVGIGKGRGWTFIPDGTKNPYQVTCRKQYVGRFPTPEAAEAAYHAAVQKVIDDSDINPAPFFCKSGAYNQ